MPYCQKCGKKLEEKQKFCHGCGSGSKEDNIRRSKKWIFITIGIIIASILIFFVIDNKGSQTGFSISGSNIEYEKKECVSECCLEGEFFAKQCSQNYNCINNKCIAIDSDNDGLTDIEEISIGTNPQLYDSDGDTLSDYQEYKVLGTNPLKKNTDGDRYDDNEDPNPLEKNTANIYIEGTSSSELNYFNIGFIILSGGLGALDPNLELYSTSVDLEIINDGNDYTSYGSYDVVVLIGNDIIDTKTFSFGRINAGSSIPQSTTFSTTIEDIPSQLISIITQEGDSSVEVRNIQYEKF